jgi:hypothetical protein
MACTNNVCCTLCHHDCVWPVPTNTRHSKLHALAFSLLNSFGSNLGLTVYCSQVLVVQPQRCRTVVSNLQNGRHRRALHSFCYTLSRRCTTVPTVISQQCVFACMLHSPTSLGPIPFSADVTATADLIATRPCMHCPSTTSPCHLSPPSCPLLIYMCPDRMADMLHSSSWHLITSLPTSCA